MEDKFIPNTEKNKQHISYEEHSYVISIKIKEKIENNTLIEKGCNNDGDLDKKNYQHIYKFLNNIYLKPIDAKIEFSKQFPKIDISLKSIKTYIITKYRESCNIDDEKIKNTNNIFIMKDDNNEQISEVYSYYSPEDTN